MLPLGFEESQVPTPRHIRQSLPTMAQSWDNEPGGISLRPSCLQDVHCLPQFTNSFLSTNQLQPVPPSNISSSGLKHNLEWCAPIWLSDLYRIIDLTVHYPESLPKGNLNGSKTPSLLPSCTLKQQSPILCCQNGEEAAVVYSSRETERKYVRLCLFAVLLTSSDFLSFPVFTTIKFPRCFYGHEAFYRFHTP